MIHFINVRKLNPHNPNPPTHDGPGGPRYQEVVGWRGGNQSAFLPPTRIHALCGDDFIAALLLLQLLAYVTGILSAHAQKARILKITGFKTSKFFFRKPHRPRWCIYYTTVYCTVKKFVLHNIKTRQETWLLFSTFSLLATQNSLLHR